MIIKPMLASDFGPLMLYVLGFLFWFTLFGFVCLAITSSIGRNTWWGFLLGLFCTLGGLFAFVSIWAGDSRLDIFTVAAALPLVCGLLSLVLWGVDRKGWSALILRIVLYGSIIVGGLVLFALWVRPY